MVKKKRTVNLFINGGAWSASDVGFTGDECEELIKIFGTLLGQSNTTWTKDHDKKKPVDPHTNDPNVNDEVNEGGT